MLSANVENMLVTSIGSTLETGVVPMQYTPLSFRLSTDSRKLESTLVRLLISAWETRTPINLSPLYPITPEPSIMSRMFFS